MHERALREALEEYAARRFPTPPDLWPAIRARAASYRHLSHHGGMPPVRQGVKSDETARGVWRQRRGVAAVANVVATVMLLTAVSLVLALVPGGAIERQERGGQGLAASPIPIQPPEQPFPVPADCPVTPLHAPEERGGYQAYWLDDHGLSLGIESGVLYEGVSYARSTDLRTLEGQLKDGPPVPLNLYGLREESGFGAVEFPAPGCWRIEGRSWRDRENRFAATVYVYPGQCRMRAITEPALPAFPAPCVAPDGISLPPSAVVPSPRPPSTAAGPPDPPGSSPLQEGAAYPYPVSASCSVTPLGSYESRGAYSGYWLDGEGGLAVAFSAERVLLADSSGANATVWLTPGPPFAITGRLGEGPQVDLLQNAHYAGPGLSPGSSTHRASLVFPQPGCWRIEASAGPGRLSATIYVYPFACDTARRPSGGCTTAAP